MTPFRLTSLIFLFSISACVRVQAETPWIDADSLRETVGLGNEWDEWQPEEIEGWKYIENFGAFFPWSNWIYHLDHGWLYPVAEDLGSIWFYSLKLNNNWIWTSQNHFDFFYIHKSGGFYFYDQDSRGEFFHDFQKGEWMLWYKLPDLFPTDLSWIFESPPSGMVLIPEGIFKMGGINGAEVFTDSDNDGKYDASEPFEDSNGNGEYDHRQGYDDEYPQQNVDLSPYYISQFEVTNQLWNQVVEWALTRPDKPEDQRDQFAYQFDSLEYLDAEITATAYRKLENAYNNYNSNPSDLNRKEYDKKLEAFNAVLFARDEKSRVIEAYRIANPSFPVNYVSWSDCVKWCNAYSEMSGRTPVYYVDRGLAGTYRTSQKDSIIELENGYVKWYADGFRLPTEAEWEKAARGGLEDKLYPTGDFLDSSLENIGGTSGQSIVGSYPPNGYGLYDIGGNLQEWCWDWKEDYDEIQGSFSVNVPSRNLTVRLVLEDLGRLSTEEEILNALTAMILDSRLNLQVEASLEEAHLVFNLVDPSYGEYLYISDLDRIAISILGLRELESSLPLTLEASATPSGVWSTAAPFTLSITDLETSRITDYSVVAQPPAPGKVLTLYTIVSQLNDSLQEAGLEGMIKAGTSGDRIFLSLESGYAPSSFKLSIDPLSPMSTVIGFSDGQETTANSDTSTLIARNQVVVAIAKVDPHGPVDGDRRVFRGGRWDFNSFHSRISSRSSHLPYLPTKNISFRTVIGLHRESGR